MKKRLWWRVACLATVLCVSVNALAECRGSQNLPSEQLHVAFDANSKTISGSESRRLDAWIATMNSKYAIQHWVTVVGSAADNERDAKSLAMKRAVAVAKEALDNGLVNAPLQVRTQVYPVEHPDTSLPETREVTVEVSPGCPGNCCDAQ